MARVYNTKQQSLNSKKIAELFSFVSNDFGGLISNIENPIEFETNEGQVSWTWSDDLTNPIKFIGGGVDIEVDKPDSPSLFINTSSEYCYMHGLDITIPSNNSSIITNTYDLCNIIQVPCEGISINKLYAVINNPSGDPSINGYYEYSEETGEYTKSQDTTVQEGKVYYYELPNEVYSITNANFSDGSSTIQRTFEYYGNTVWITDNRFFIPFCCIDKSNNAYSMIFNRDKTGYESFLSARTYYHLLNELGNQFVFRSGGPTKGDIGNLNITSNEISNRFDTGLPTDGGVKIKNLMLDIADAGQNPNMDYILLIDNNSGKIFKTNGEYIIPIKHGGTNAEEEYTARKNLGFSYGPGDPSNEPKRYDGITTDEGAVYFKIL